MYKHNLFILIFILSVLLLHPQVGFSQGTAEISGKFTGKVPESIAIYIDYLYVGEQLKTQEVVVRGNSFKEDITLDRNRVIKLALDDQTIPIYIEPGDKLSIEFEEKNGGYILTFNGHGAANNDLLRDFKEKFGNEYDWKALNQIIVSTDIDPYEMVLFNQKEEQWKFYRSYPEAEELSDDFKDYIENNIKYQYYRGLFAFPIIRAENNLKSVTVSPLPSVMTESFSPSLLNNPDALIVETYRDFIYYTIIYFTSEENHFEKFTDWDKSLESKFYYSRQHLDVSEMVYFLSRYLFEHCDKFSPEEILKVLASIVELEKKLPSTGYVSYSELIKKHCETWINPKETKNNRHDKHDKQEKNSRDELITKEGKVGKNDSPFKLENLDGEEVSLDDFKGKVLYVDFWASWCGPCRQQFPFSRKLHEKLTKKQKKKIIFLYISIDQNEKSWKNAIDQNHLENGVNLRSPGGWGSSAIRYFNIISIPHYMLIDAHGNIVDSDAKRPSYPGILDDILNLIE